MRKIIFLIIILLILIINVSGKLDKTKKNRSNKVIEQKQEQDQFVINFIFAFCILPFVLLVLQGEALKDDFQMEILLAIFCWIIIFTTYYLLTNYWANILQNKKVVQLKASIHKVLHQKVEQAKISKKSIHKTMSKHLKRSYSIPFQHADYLISHFNQTRWEINLLQRNGNLTKKIEIMLFYQKKMEGNVIQMRGQTKEFQSKGTIGYVSGSYYIELNTGSGFQIYGRLKQNHEEERFEGTWQQNGQSGLLTMWEIHS